MSETLLNPTTFTGCFVCGMDNPDGLRLRIHRDGDAAVAVHTPTAQQVGYPDRFHGGLAALLIDEMLVYAGVCHDLWGMTARVSYRLREAMPVGSPVQIRAEVTRMRPRAFVAVATLTVNGQVVADGEGTCMVTGEAAALIARHSA